MQVHAMGTCFTLAAVAVGAFALDGNDVRAALADAAQARPAPRQPAAGGDARPGRGRADRGVAFVENRGQWAPDVLFTLRRGALRATFERAAWTLWLADGPVAGRPADGALRLVFEGARDDVRIEGRGRRRERHHYLRGSDPERWRTDVPAFETVSYRSLYRGIDVRVRAGGGLLEYDLLLAPGANLEDVVIRCEGARDVAVEPDGSLRLDTARGPLLQAQPTTWVVEADGGRRPVDCRYAVIDACRYGFRVSGVHSGEALVVDPGIDWCTYLGGGLNDHPADVAVSPDGLVTVVGWTRSPDFPVTRGAYDPRHHAGNDAFVARLDPSESGDKQLVWSTYLGGQGGNAGDRALSLALAPDGGVVVVGSTDSPDFPVTRDAYDTSYGGNGDAFVARLSADGSTLLYSTFLAGDEPGYQNDVAHAVALADDGSVYVTGQAGSPDFPTTPGAYDTEIECSGGPFSVCNDVFVAVLRTGGLGPKDLVYSTFLGGWNVEEPADIAVAPDGDALVVGLTLSTATGWPRFPTTPGAFDATPSTDQSTEGFLARIRPAGKGAADLRYSTYLDGLNTDLPRAVVAQPDGRVLVAGSTASEDFPVTPGALQTQIGSEMEFDGFVSLLELSSAGAADLVYSTYLGGAGPDFLVDLAGPRSGEAVVVGWTGPEGGLPVTAGALDTTPEGPQCGLLFHLLLGGNGGGDVSYGTYLAGAGFDEPAAVAMAGSGAAVVVGKTTSGDLPVTPGAYDPSYEFDDLFLLRLDLTPVVSTYCTGKTNSLGCVPFVTFQGTPSVTDTEPFDVSALDVVPDEVGLLLYGRNGRAGLGFHGGTLCVKPPLVRWLPPKSSGSPGGGACPGRLRRDFNARIQTGGDPTLTVGQRIHAQFLYRDPALGDAFGDGLSDGVAFTVQP